MQGPDELVEVADPFLEQVAQAGHAVDQQLEGVVLLDVLGEHHHTDVGMLGADPLRGLDAFVGVASAASGCRSARRPGEVSPTDLISEAASVAIATTSISVDLGQERGEALTNQVVVIGDDEAECHSLRL